MGVQEDEQSVMPLNLLPPSIAIIIITMIIIIIIIMTILNVGADFSKPASELSVLLAFFTATPPRGRHFDHPHFRIGKTEVQKASGLTQGLTLSTDIF